MKEPTPGPWVVRQDPRDPNAWDVYAVSIGEGYKVAHLPWQRKADAHLIAAAPELLFACRMVMEMAVGWQPLTPGDISEVKAAIAKAEGR